MLKSNTRTKGVSERERERERIGWAELNSVQSKTEGKSTIGENKRGG